MSQATAQQGGGDMQDRLLSHYLIELAGETYAFPQSGDVRMSWVQRPQTPTYLPTLPAWCAGLVNARNVPVLLIDLAAVLGLPPQQDRQTSDWARHVFLERSGETIGVLVERTRRFRQLPAQGAAPGGDFIAATVHIDGLAVRVLDLEAVWRFVLRELGVPPEPRVMAGV